MIETRTAKQRPADITAGMTIDFDTKGVASFYQDSYEGGFDNWERVTGQHVIASIKAITGRSTTSRRSNRYYEIILENGREIQVSHQAKLTII